MVDSPNTRNTSASSVALIVLVALGYYLVAFYPYQLAVPAYAVNGASWLPDGSLGFKRPGIAIETHDLHLTGAMQSGKTVRVVVDAYSFSIGQTGPARIVSFSRDPYRRNLTIAQSNADLVVRVRRAGSDLNGMPNLVIPGVFAVRRWHRIEVDVLPGSVVIGVDGVTLLTEPGNLPAISLWDGSYPFVFGNERTGDRPWRGKIRQAEVCADDTCVDAFHPDRLSIPGRYWVGDWRKLIDMRQLGSSAPIDILINLFGFMPFGILIARVRGPVATWKTIALWAGVFSLSIEIGQILFQNRYTSLIDLFFNVTGALAGYAILQTALRRDSDERR